MTTDSQPLIDCRNVRKMFPDPAGVPFPAVDGVSFRLSAGEIVGLLGPDGAGKTTLIRLITGLMKPHEGSISVLNLDSVKKARAIQASIGYMPQKFGLYEDLTVKENMELYARMHGVSGQDREKRFRSLLSMTSLERFTTRLAGKLSGGMKQKLGLCCSLVSSPPLILLDEPTVGVDPLSRRELWNILGQFSHEEGVGVLVSTSYMDESAYCNRTLIMYKGGLLMDAPPADVIARAEGMCITVRTPEGIHARQFQSRLAALPVSYQNLIPDTPYKLVGTLMDKTTQKEVMIDGKPVTAETEFTPKDSNGSVEVIFTFDGSTLAGHDVVVFEKLFSLEGETALEIASHEDLDDKGQTIKLTEAPKDTPEPSKPVKTGDETTVLPYLLLAGAALLFAAGFGILYIRKRKKDK